MWRYLFDGHVLSRGGSLKRSVPKILLVSYHFPPSRAIGARRAERLARLLPQHGYRVDVVCAGRPGSGPTSDPSTGVRVFRTETPHVFGRDPTSQPGRGISRGWWKARAYVEWLFWTTEWSWAWARESLRENQMALADSKYDAMLVSGPPHPALAPFVRFARARDIPVVVDLRDIWAVVDEEWPAGWFLRPRVRRHRWQLRLRDQVLASAARVVCNTPEMGELMAARVPALREKGLVDIPNAFESVDALSEVTAPNTLVHTGTLAYGRVDQAIALTRALGLLAERGGPIVRLVLAGPLTDRVVSVAEREGLSRHLVGHEWLERDEAIALQRSAAALVLFQSDGLGSAVAVPGKLYEYMERRKYMLAIAGEGPTRRLISEHDLGEVVGASDPEEIANAVGRLLARVQDQDEVPEPPEEFSAEATALRFKTVLDSVLSQ